MMEHLAQILLLLGVTVAVVLVFQRFHAPASLGYLLVGVILGPHTAGPTVYVAEFATLAQFGVVFLLFTIGLNFSLPQLHALRHQVLGVGTGQVVFATAAVGLLSWAHRPARRRRLRHGGRLRPILHHPHRQPTGGTGRGEQPPRPLRPRHLRIPGRHRRPVPGGHPGAGGFGGGRGHRLRAWLGAGQGGLRLRHGLLPQPLDAASHISSHHGAPLRGALHPRGAAGRAARGPTRLLAAIHIERASLVVITVDDAETSIRAVSFLRNRCPQVPIIARARDLETSSRLLQAGATHAHPEAIEASLRLGAEALQILHVPTSDIDQVIEGVRDWGYRPVLEPAVRGPANSGGSGKEEKE